MKLVFNPLAVAALVLMLIESVQTPAFGHGDAVDSGKKVQKLINDVRRATTPFRDVDEAIRADYVKFPDQSGDCVAEPGQGAMGIHYLNGGLISTVLDPLRPAALMYQPAKHGKLELLGVGYIVFQAAWDALHPQPPVLFSHPRAAAAHGCRPPASPQLESVVGSSGQQPKCRRR